MKILSMDTSTATGGVALLDSEKGLLGNYMLNQPNSHSTRLFIAIENLLKDSKMTMQDMDVIAVIIGPGSFTGLRIGLMAAKTFSYLGNMKLIGISTLEAIAYPLRYTEGLICPVLDALRGDLYASLYHSQKGNWEQKIPDTVISLEDYLHRLEKEFHHPPFHFIGNAVGKYQDTIQKQLGDKALFPSSNFQMVSPAVVAQLALEKINNNTVVYLDPLEAKPNYLRRPEAEIVWERQHQANNK